MKNKTLGIIAISAVTAIASGCATYTTHPDGSSVNPLCILAGAIVGGGGSAAVLLAAGPIGGGAFVGALLGTLACSKGPTPAPPMAAAVEAPMAPVAMPEPDSDGDGVVDRLDACPDTPHGKKVDARGCPEILLTLTGVKFNFDKSTIKPDAAQILNQAVDELNKASTVDVRIEGHTDSIGSDAYNLKLSQRRADSVEQYLVDHGISASRLTTEGKGESQPVASNETAEGRYQNRRVEFHVTGESEVYSTMGVAPWQSLDQPVTYY